MYEQYLREEVPRLVREHLERAVSDEAEQIEESLRAQLVEYIRAAQEQAFSNYGATVAVVSKDSEPPLLVEEAPGSQIANALPEPQARSAHILGTFFQAPPPQDEFEAMLALSEFVPEGKTTLQTGFSDSGFVSNLSNIFPSTLGTGYDGVNLGCD
jgi:hypothetical protein